ncbi:STAS domain protein [Novipirellula galeiformis]|uniref:STAS domain protein n=1 Tax=Novipirellula galeiformis TaxID=2528004 RepID=A0A5C6C8S3_9BACT|nr:STAS domain-containing protein [Novipirellula galeiformis]TWU20980.1 STAS domain protein [Novipirellula galeiformis]
MFQCSKQGSVFVLSGNDPLSRDHTLELAGHCDNCFGHGQPKIVFDLRNVPLLDSAGLEFLLDLRDRCLRHGGAVQLAAPNPLCQEILQATELQRDFTIWDDLVSAVGSFSR